ncbi:MAG: hypothetical protein ACE5IK_07025 [Acidobacteriota bacterium]
MKNAVREAEKALLAQDVATPVVRTYMEQLERLQRDLDYRHLDRGLVVFVGTDIFEWHFLPHRVEPAVVVDENFLTRDLVRAINRRASFDLLVLSEKATRFFRGLGRQITEERRGAFPMSGESGATDPAPGGFSKGVDPKGHRNDRLRVFMRRVSQEVQVRRARSPRPLFLAGVERLRSMYQDTSGTNHVAGQIEGSFEQATLPDLNDSVHPAVEAWLRRRRQEVLDRFDEVKGTRHGLVGLEEIGKAATFGRIGTLLVEDPYSVPGRFNRRTGEIVAQAEGSRADGPADVVDEIVETVVEKGGDVVFYRDGRLAQATAPPMGAILRF